MVVQPSLLVFILVNDIGSEPHGRIETFMGWRLFFIISGAVYMVYFEKALKRAIRRKKGL